MCDIRSWPAQNSPEDWRRCLAGLTKLKKAADQRAIEIVFATPPMFDAKQRPEQAFYEGVMHQYASWLIAQQEQGWHVIDVRFAMQTLLDAQRESDPDFTFQPDAVHPNAAGHQVIAAALVRSFAPDFDIAEFDSPAYRAHYAITHSKLKATQRKLFEATRHRRAGIPGYVAE